MKNGLIAFFFICIFLSVKSGAQVTEQKNWCFCECVAGDEMKNAKRLYGKLRKEFRSAQKDVKDVIKFPLRIASVVDDADSPTIGDHIVQQAIQNLNIAFTSVGIQFYIDKLETIQSNLYIEDLSENYYDPYNKFSTLHDIDDMISIYIFDHAHKFCDVSETSISCGRKGGFSYILSGRTNNIVLSTFDVSDQKIMAHEFGHFFGLFHTFEETMFGKDNFETDQCHILGDCICDTPPDPGTVYEVYVNYSECNMKGLLHESGNVYEPMIENYMSYYKPCYLRRYQFTPGQIEVIQTAARSDLRSHFSRRE